MNLTGIMKSKSLSADETQKLFVKLNTETLDDDQKSEIKNEILLGNLGLVFSVAKRYFKYTTLETDDLINDGIVGLRVAIDKFDMSKKTAFSTCAYWWILHYARQHLNKNHLDGVRSHSRSIDVEIGGADDEGGKTFAEVLIDRHDTAAAADETDNNDLLRHVADVVLTPHERLLLKLRYMI